MDKTQTKPHVHENTKFRMRLLTSASLTALVAGSLFGQLKAAGAPALNSGVFSALQTNAATLRAGMGANLPTPGQAVALAQRQAATLAKVNNSLAALQAAQAAGRAAAIKGPNNLGANPNHLSQFLPDVPNGLGTGGLDAGGYVPNWVNAGAPVQTSVIGQSVVTINQTGAHATLNWTTFNIGKNTILDFNQQGHFDWIALNKINDPSGVPSQILGQIHADGQVYVINKNGIIFGGGSQINTHGFIASTLNHWTDPVNQGSASVNFSNSNVVESGLDGSGNLLPSFSAVGNNASVIVNQGAQIATSIDNAGNGGNVSLFAPTIINNGTIATPNGQTLLAGGDRIWLTAQNQPFLRGLTPLADGPGDIVNNGIITATRGNVGIIGATITQNGVVSATTAVDANGAINITAASLINYIGYIPYPTIGGTLTIGPNSVTQVQPDTMDSATTTASESALPSSQISLQGALINLQGNAAGNTGAMVLAPSGTIQVSASGNFSFFLKGPTPPGTINDYYLAYPTFSTDGSRIYAAPGTLIDASGLADVAAPVAQNLVQVQLRGPQFADSPLQRNGPLYRSNVTVDARVTGVRADGSIWVGTPFADASGYIALVGQTISQLSVNGGRVNLNSNGDIILRQGSTVNVSGGTISYQGGMISTTKLVTADGHIVDISKADPNRAYAGTCCSFTDQHPRWGVSESYSLKFPGVYSPGYVQGAAAGTIAIDAWALALDGALLGNATSGPFQRSPAGAASNGSLLIAAQQSIARDLVNGGLIYDPVVGFQGSVGIDFRTITQSIAIAGGTPLPVSFSVISDLASTADAAQLPLSAPMLNQGGFGRIVVGIVSNHVGGILYDTVTSPVTIGNDLTLPAVGNLTIAAPSITIAGKITAPGGNITLQGVNNQAPLLSAGVVNFTAKGAFDLAGTWINDRIDPFTVATTAISGGSVAITAPAGFIMPQGSIIDVSGGGWLKLTGAPVAGASGNITINAGLGNSAVSNSATTVELDGALLGYSLEGFTPSSNQIGKTGILSIIAPSFQIGGVNAIAYSPLNLTVTQSGDVADIPYNLTSNNIALPLSYFSHGGFGNYQISGDILTLAPGITLSPLPQSRVFQASSYLSLTSGGDLATVTQIGVLPFIAPKEAPKRVATSISLTAKDVALGNLVLDLGSSIIADPGATVSLTAGHQLTIFGTINTPGGTINLNLFGGWYEWPNNSSQSLWIGNGAQLLARGTPLVALDPISNERSGTILNGGNVNILAQTNYADIQPGALIDVSGSSGIIDLPKEVGKFVATYQASDGGGISIRARDAVYVDGALIGHAGDWKNPAGSIAQGGKLSIGIARYNEAVNCASSCIPGTNDVLEVERGLIITTGPTAASTIQLGQSLLTIPSDQPRTTISLYFPSKRQSAIPAINKSSWTYYSTAARPTPLAWSSGGYASAPVDALHPLYGYWLNNIVETFTGDGPYIGGVLDSFTHYTASFAGSPTSGPGFGNISTQSFRTGGFDQLTLTGQSFLKFIGNVALSTRRAVTLSAPIISASDSSAVSITSNYVNITSPKIPSGLATNPSLTYAGGAAVNSASLTVNANFIDVSGAVAFGRPGQNAVINSFAIPSGNPEAIIPIRTLSIDEPSFDLPSFTNVALNSSRDVRFGSVGATPLDYTLPKTLLSSAGNITISGSVIYPGTDVAASIVSTGANGTITLASSSLGRTIATPLSAGGSLSVYANTINQGGNLVAPIGNLTLGCETACPTTVALPTTSNLNLLPGSVTSVSAYGAIIPYGTVANGVDWYGSSGLLITQPPQKTINLQAQNIISSPGSTINGSGGGDLYAYEFVAGPGGSKDVLASANVFAIVPGYTGSVAPDDVTYNTGSALLFGQKVHLAASPGLVAGDYTLLPGHYALLPGAFRVTISNNTDTPPGTSLAAPDGANLVAGIYTWNGLNSTRSDGSIGRNVTFEVDNAALTRSLSGFNNYYADSFFAAAALQQGIPAPRLPQDGALLAIGVGSATTTGSFQFQGQALFNHAPAARGAIASFSDNYAGASIAIVGSGSENTSYAGNPLDLAVQASSLNQLKADTLIIGGTIQPNVTGIDPNTNRPIFQNALLTPAASEIDIDNEAVLTGSEIILVAANTVDIRGNSLISASGLVTPSASDALILGHVNQGVADPIASQTGDAALLIVSGGPVRSVTHAAGTVANATGSVILESGTSVTGGGSLIIDATATGALLPGALIAAPQIYATSNSISIGDVPLSVTNSLIIAGPVLQQLQTTRELTLRSYTSIDFYGVPVIGAFNAASEPYLGAVTLDAGALNNMSPGGVATINAGAVTLTDTLAPTFASFGGSGSLLINAKTISAVNNSGQITIGSAAAPIPINGFDNVVFNASNQIVSSGTGGITVPGNLTLVTPRLTATYGATQSLIAGGTLSLNNFGTLSAIPVTGSLAAQLSLIGSAVTLGSLIDLRSGTLKVHATGAGGISVNGGAIDVSGWAMSFFDQIRAEAGGTITLAADQGNITIGNGAHLNVSGYAGRDGYEASAAGNVTITAGIPGSAGLQKI